MSIIKYLNVLPKKKENCPQCKRVRQALELLGIPKNRAKSPAHALEVYVGRIEKQISQPKTDDYWESKYNKLTTIIMCIMGDNYDEKESPEENIQHIRNGK